MGEGYFHGRSEPNSIKSLNPRNGKNMNKPAGPARIRAFIQATRQKNEKLLAKVAACFDEKSSIRKLFESENIFCDIAIQIRYGSGILGQELQWHLDSFNSMLHMAVALHGVRTLHSKTKKENSNLVTKYENIQRPGDVYLSSPAAFEHAVGHNTVERGDRVVAMQCRVLVNMGELKEGLDKIAAITKQKQFCLPNLQEVK